MRHAGELVRHLGLAGERHRAGWYKRGPVHLVANVRIGVDGCPPTGRARPLRSVRRKGRRDWRLLRVRCPRLVQVRRLCSAGSRVMRHPIRHLLTLKVKRTRGRRRARGYYYAVSNSSAFNQAHQLTPFDARRSHCRRGHVCWRHGHVLILLVLGHVRRLARSHSRGRRRRRNLGPCRSSGWRLWPRLCRLRCRWLVYGIEAALLLQSDAVDTSTQGVGRRGYATDLPSTTVSLSSVVSVFPRVCHRPARTGTARDEHLPQATEVRW